MARTIRTGEQYKLWPAKEYGSVRKAYRRSNRRSENQLCHGICKGYRDADETIVAPATKTSGWLSH